VSKKKGITGGVNRKLAIACFVVATTAIAVVDYNMGEKAAALNGYEILRRTFLAPLGIDAPVRSDHYIIKQETFGRFALVWAWCLYLLWAGLLARCLYALIRRVHRNKGNEDALFEGHEGTEVRREGQDH
jgi:hypothetical protein